MKVGRLPPGDAKVKQLGCSTNISSFLFHSRNLFPQLRFPQSHSDTKMSGFAREIRAREFLEMQIDFARLVGLEYPDEARQRSWAYKNFRVICSQLYELKFFPHQYFEYHDWMDFSQMELRKDLMSRYKLLDVLVSFQTSASNLRRSC